MLKGKCIAFSTYKKRKKSKISDLKFYSKKLKKEKNRMKKIVEIIKNVHKNQWNKKPNQKENYQSTNIILWKDQQNR